MANQYVEWGIAVVKVGFIVEGETEEYILKHSDKFHQYLHNFGYELHKDFVISIGGKAKFKNSEIMQEKIKALKGVDKIFLLLDADDESPESISNSLTNLYSKQNSNGGYFVNDIEFIFIAVKETENWYFADNQAMNQFLKIDNFNENNPELINNAWEYLKEISKNNRGSSKPMFARKMLKWGFSIENSASHPNCPSAKVMIDYFKNRECNK